MDSYSNQQQTTSLLLSINNKKIVINWKKLMNNSQKDRLLDQSLKIKNLLLSLISKLFFITTSAFSIIFYSFFTGTCLRLQSQKSWCKSGPPSWCPVIPALPVPIVHPEPPLNSAPPGPPVYPVSLGSSKSLLFGVTAPP